MSTKVLKFGGSSLASSERIQRLTSILQQENTTDHLVLVVSAFGSLENEPKVTDRLLLTATQASHKNSEYTQSLDFLKHKHIGMARDLELISPDFNLQNSTPENSLERQLQEIFEELETILQGIYLMQELTDRTTDLVLSFGERLSALIISEYLSSLHMAPVTQLDTRQVILTDSRFGQAKVDSQATDTRVQNFCYNLAQPGWVVATGFIAAEKQGHTTTLGRGGSDYTASILASALDATEIQIWSDVDGVMTSDPRKVSKAFPLENLTYSEAMEISHFGAKVVYPPTIEPARQKTIPVWIKNSFKPELTGTIIDSNYSTSKSYPFAIKGVTSLSDIALLRVQGSGLKGKRGISARVFSALAKAHINIILISQASSEYSICLAVKESDATQSEHRLRQEFIEELEANLIETISTESDLSVISIVGQNMQRSPGVSGRMFQTLGRNGINVVAIAQGSNELNISAVISQRDETKAVQVVHDEFFSVPETKRSLSKTLNLFLVGASGAVGSKLLEQIAAQREYLLQENHLDLQIRGLANSHGYCFFDSEEFFSIYQENYTSSNSHTRSQSTSQLIHNLIQERGHAQDISHFGQDLLSQNPANAVLVDCTASEVVTQIYESMLGSSVSVVTPNKKAATSSLDRYQKLKQLTRDHNCQYYFEANVGAGLPVLSTLQDLRRSGDEIYQIEAILSGTLSYIFNTFTPATTFSQVVQQAQAQGYTEPDPREDLSGLDVARKILILAREIGLPATLEDIQLESLVPEELSHLESPQEFMEKLPQFDEDFAQQIKQAEDRGHKLRYLATLTNKSGQYEIRVQLKSVTDSHPFYNLAGTDNIIAFHTRRYNQTPLVIKGPGAGVEVTAGGVFADIIRCGNQAS